jgi:hypothetical protein
MRFDKAAAGLYTEIVESHGNSGSERRRSELHAFRGNDPIRPFVLNGRSEMEEFRQARPERQGRV